MIAILSIIEYPPDGSRWTDTRVSQPSWEAIEEAIRQLDRHRFPLITLFVSADAGDDAVPDFTVMGGESAYVLGNANGMLHFGGDSDALITVWTSDQGASYPAEYVCSEIETVLGATQAFYETGLPEKFYQGHEYR